MLVSRHFKGNIPLAYTFTCSWEQRGVGVFRKGKGSGHPMMVAGTGMFVTPCDPFSRGHISPHPLVKDPGYGSRHEDREGIRSASQPYIFCTCYTVNMQLH